MEDARSCSSCGHVNFLLADAAAIAVFSPGRLNGPSRDAAVNASPFLGRAHIFVQHEVSRDPESDSCRACTVL